MLQIREAEKKEIPTIAKICESAGNNAEVNIDIAGTDVRIRGIPLGYSRPEVIEYEWSNIFAKSYIGSLKDAAFNRQKGSAVATGSYFPYKIWKAGKTKDGTRICAPLIGDENLKEQNMIIGRLMQKLRLSEDEILNHFEQEMFIRSVAVYPDIQGHGLGGQMISHITDHITRSEQFDKIVAFTEVYNTPMIAIFKKKGFVIEGLQWFQGDLYYKISHMPEHYKKRLLESSRTSDIPELQRLMEQFLDGSTNSCIDIMECLDGKIDYSNPAMRPLLKFYITRKVDEIREIREDHINNYILLINKRETKKYEFEDS